jgi:splicing factor U2AF subunit
MEGMMAGVVGVAGVGGVVPAVPAGVDRQSRRLYVGNIPVGITEAEIQDFFNTAMVAAKACARPGNPVMAVQINVEKSYAFLEMRAPDEASAGMSFDGIMLHGHALKVRRPKDYIPAPAIDMTNGPSLPAGAIVATNVPDSPYKIFIGGLPANLDEQQVKDLLQTFGPLKAFNLVKDIGTGLSKGFAFCEYLDEKVTDRACAGLNGMKLGDKQLLVQRASIGAKNPLQSMGMLAPAPIALPSGPLTASPANILNLAIPAVTLLSSITTPQNQGIKSRVLCLLNLASVDELDDDDEYAAVVEDVREECSKFGPVKQVIIPRRKNLVKGEDKKPEISLDLDGLDSPSGSGGALVPLDNGSPTPAQLFQQQIEKLQKAHAQVQPKERICPLVKVYVEFENCDECAQALHKLAGRRYNGHVIITALFPEGLFLQGTLF